MSVGYSGKPLAVKLGLKEGLEIHTVGAPTDYAALLGPLPGRVTIREHATAADLVHFLNEAKRQTVFAHCFVTTRSQLAEATPLLAAALAPSGMLWMSWPKHAAAKKLGLSCDLSEETLRELLLPTGLVDVKVCAVSDLWSGLKFVWRKR